MPAYNAEAFVAQAVESILSQTMTDLEVIVVDDASTDRTYDIVSRYTDPRLRVLRNDRNMGVVGSRNRGSAEARAPYLAPFDADDVSLPTKLARQVSLLDDNPGLALVGTATRYLEAGEILPGKSVENTAPGVLRWLMHVNNPLGHGTVMYRASGIEALGTFMLEDYIYAEDFEYWHRLMKTGEIGFINESLVLYRRHAGAVSARHQDGMQANTAKVLEGVYRPWFQDDAAQAAHLIARFPFQRRAPDSVDDLRRLGTVLERLLDGFMSTYKLTPAERVAVTGQASKLWLASRRSAVRTGLTGAVAIPPPSFVLTAGVEAVGGSSNGDLLVSALSGRIPFRTHLKSFMERNAGVTAAPRLSPPTHLSGTVYKTAPTDPDRPATLFVVVDCEAEFDWSKPFDRAQTSVKALQAVERGQAVFDRYGLRPVYVTDYAVVSQPDGYRPLRAIHDRGGCALGAHLHPWINPPFDEVLSVHNSYAGNLPVALEREKLRVLIAAFVAAFGFRPRFFKAGRYGVGPHTMELLAEAGIRVDFSVIPGRDLSPMGGPDFRAFDSAPRLAADGQVLCLPMTRERIGILGRSRWAARIANGPGRALALPGVLSRLGLMETVTLTPEGETAPRQIALIRAMLARGQRHFVLHYHSPSLAAGFTPYGATPAETDEIVARLEQVCAAFFEQIGGVPGNPNDLLPMAEREVPPGVSTAGPT